MGRFTTVLWDVDGTLLDFIYSQRWAMRKCFESIGKEITEEMLNRYSQINDSYWKRLELGEVTKAELLIGRFETFLQEYQLEDVDAKAFAKEYQEHLGNVYKLIDDSLEYCKSLQGKVKQYVVTNGVTATQESKLKISGLYDVMDGIFISEAIGAPKPQKEFFDYCLSHIEETDRQKVLIVGDSMSSDIKGGVMAGIGTCLYATESGAGASNEEKQVKISTSDYQPDYIIGKLQQLSAILGL